MSDTPLRLGPDDPALPAVLALLRDSFAYMEDRIDPPSSLTRMTEATLARDAAENELWVIPGAPGTAPLACVILTRKPDHLYIGKLAVARDGRGRGLARRLIGLAEDRARAQGLTQLRLQTRIELTENHATFTRLGFTEIARTAHEGYDRPTSLTFAKEI